MPILSKATGTKAAWIGGTVAVVELAGYIAGHTLPWWFATILIAAVGALAAYTLDEHL